MVIPTKNGSITYPAVHNSLINILIDSSYNVASGQSFSLASYLPVGTNIKIILKPSANYNVQGYGVESGSIVGYTMNSTSDSMVFTGAGNNTISNANIIFGAWIPTSTDIIIYENNATSPTRMHKITTN
jgi:hypothetical protein